MCSTTGAAAAPSQTTPFRATATGGATAAPVASATMAATSGTATTGATSVAGAAGGAATEQHAGHAAMPKVPPSTPTIRSLLVNGSYGPTVPEGEAKTIRIPDGKGFGGVKGREQNDDDKDQNNYSVTDANFFPTLGVLQNPETGKPMNYVQQIQAYNAAGYVSTFHPETYAVMVQQQDAGQGSILGMALNLMGVDGAPTDPGMIAGGLTSGAFANENVPGAPIKAKDAVMSGTDLAGEEWARPHHAESAWPMYKSLIDSGLDYQTASVLSGDDAVSGAGRMNGFNNQDGETGFNEDEQAVYRVAAQVQQQTGIPVVQIMAGGHSHTGIHESAKTKPAINEFLGLDENDVSASPERANAIYQALINGKINEGDVGKFALADQDELPAGVTSSSVLTAAVGGAEATRESEDGGRRGGGGGRSEEAQGGRGGRRGGGDDDGAGRARLLKAFGAD